MRIFSWNVNGVRAIEKKGFLDWVDAIAPDILCIQETKAHFEQLPDSLQNMEGYHGYWHSGERKGYSGVATFSKQEPLHVQYGLGIEKYDREGRVLITDKLLGHAKIKNSILFVGLGKTFQIWEPKSFENFKIVARKKAYQNRSNLKWDNKLTGEKI